MLPPQPALQLTPHLQLVALRSAVGAMVSPCGERHNCYASSAVTLCDRRLPGLLLDMRHADLSTLTAAGTPQLSGLVSATCCRSCL